LAFVRTLIDRLPAPLTGRIFALVAGVVAGALALGVAELVASFSKGWTSPVTSVGNLVIDKVPSSVKDLAVRWFDENDKVALQIGIGVLLAIYAAIVGWVTLRISRNVGLVGIVLFGLVGAWAAQRDGGLGAIVPSVAGTIVAIGLLLATFELARRRAAAHDVDDVIDPVHATADAGDETDPSDRHATASSSEPKPVALEALGMLSVARRDFIGRSGLVLAGSAAAAGGLYAAGQSRRYSAASSRADVVLPSAADAAPRIPAGTSFDVEGITSFITPNETFYRVDTAIDIPQIAADEYELKITGYVDEERSYSFDDLLARELVERDITITCVSNQVGGKLAGTATWLGTPLMSMLEEAGVQSKADQIIGRSDDDYACGFPVSAANDGREPLVVVGMNGEPLPLEHGFPVRLVVPGLYGYVSATKWLVELELGRFDEFDHYWLRRGWAQKAPIKTMSRIDTPRGLASVSGQVNIAGVAWAQTRGIDAVEVQVDDGPWRKAELANALNKNTWRQWRIEWDADKAGGGRHEIRVRATDGTGAIQTPDRVEPIPDGASGHHQVVVLVA